MMQIKWESLTFKAAIGLICFAILVAIVFFVLNENNDAIDADISADTSAIDEAAVSDYVGLQLPHEEIQIFHPDGKINFSRITTPYRDQFWGRLFDSIVEVEWVLEEKFAFADNVVIVHIENTDRLTWPTASSNRHHSRLALPQARVLYSFKGSLQRDDRILLYEPSRTHGPARPGRARPLGLGQALEQNMIIILFMRDVDIPENIPEISFAGVPFAGLPLHAVSDWIPHEFYFNNLGNLNNAYNAVSFAEVVEMLEEISQNPARGVRPTTQSQHDDIFIFIDYQFYGVWTQDGEWRQYGNTFYDLFSARPFFRYRQGESAPIAEPPNVFYASADGPRIGVEGYHKGVLQLYGIEHDSSHTFSYYFSTNMMPGARRIGIPRHDFYVQLREHRGDSRNMRERDTLMISAEHNPSPRPARDVPVTSDMLNIVRKLLDERGMKNTIANIDYALMVDLHGDGREQTILVANTLRQREENRDWEYIISLAEKEAGAVGIYTMTIIVDQGNIHILNESYWLDEWFVFSLEQNREAEYGIVIAGDAIIFANKPLLFDLNGDGVLEIFVPVFFWEGHDSRVYAYKNGTWEIAFRQSWR